MLSACMTLLYYHVITVVAEEKKLQPKKHPTGFTL